MKLELFDHSIQNKITAITYGVLAVVLITISLHQFMMGYIDALSINLPAGLLFTLLASIRWLSRAEQDNDKFSLVGYILIAFILLNEVEHIHSTTMVWMYALPMLLFLTQPLGRAIAYSITFIIFLISSSDTAGLLTTQFQAISGLSFMFVFSGLFAYHRKIHSRRLFREAKAHPSSKLPNFAVFGQQLNEEVQRAKVSKNALSVMLIEIDDYPKLKELEGKQEASQVLVKLSRFLNQITRTGDMLFHPEDHQFWLILPNTGQDGLVVLEEKIVRRVQEEHWGLISSIKVRTSTATLNSNDTDSYNLIERCYKRMASSFGRAQSS
jgi:diguanylate cyclase